MFYFHKYNVFFDWLFPNRQWRVLTDEKVIFLTFDDGPVPGITNGILKILSDFGAKATFFCVGENVQKYPIVFDSVKEQGHTVGNHSHNHLDGFKIDAYKYLDNVNQCRLATNAVGKQLFRPPYGRLTFKQNKLLRKGYKVIMWSVLSGDFDNGLSKEQCLDKLINNTKKGSIVVMHDNPKFFEKVSWVLPRYLEYFISKGYTFKCL